MWLPFGDEAIFPNLYVLLVGEAGNGKTVALRKAKRILTEINDTALSRSVETPEGLWRYMNGEPKADPPIESPVCFIARWPDGQLRECHPMTIIANEFVNFISKDPEGWMHSLNDIYDEDKYEYRTKNKGEDNLTGPYIVILGALTTEVSFDLQKSSHHLERDLPVVRFSSTANVSGTSRTRSQTTTKKRRSNGLEL